MLNSLTDINIRQVTLKKLCLLKHENICNVPLILLSDYQLLTDLIQVKVPEVKGIILNPMVGEIN